MLTPPKGVLHRKLGGPHSKVVEMAKKKLKKYRYLFQHVDPPKGVLQRKLGETTSKSGRNSEKKS